MMHTTVLFNEPLQNSTLLQLTVLTISWHVRMMIYNLNRTWLQPDGSRQELKTSNQ